MPEMPPAQILGALAAHNMLPAIVFLPTRRRCDEAAAEAAIARRKSGDERRDERRAIIQEFAAEHPEILGHRHWDTIIRAASLPITRAISLPGNC